MLQFQEVLGRSHTAESDDKKLSGCSGLDESIDPLLHDPCELFHACSAIMMMCVDEKIRGTISDKTLIDSGSITNLISRSIVGKLQMRTIQIRGGVKETALGEKTTMDKAIWVHVDVQRASRVIAAVFVQGRPSYNLLLCRHWMADTEMPFAG